MDDFPVVIEQAVAWGEMDAFGHVNNVVYFRYFENARLEYFRRAGWWDLQDTTGVGPIVASTSARFRRALVYPDTIQIGARIVSLGTDRFTMQHRIVSTTLGEVATEGEVLVVAFDYRTKAKAPLPPELLECIARIQDLPSSSE